jgi:hypothetical protein
MGKKEPRETQRWLKLIQRVPLIKKPELPLVPKLWLGNALPGKLQLPSCYS